MKTKKLLIILIISSFLIASIIFYSEKDVILTYVRHDNQQAENSVPEQIFFQAPSLEAKSAYVFDLSEDKIIFELNSELQLPLASLTKLMTALVARENILDWMMVEITPEAILTEGDSGFFAGEKWPVSDLTKTMLISSSNDAAAALALNACQLDFLGLMNKKAVEMGLTQTYFFNPTGLDLNNYLAGAYGSAQNIAGLISYIFKKYPDLLESTQQDSVVINYRNFKNTDLLINQLPGILASKTGYSDLAGGNLAIIADAGFHNPVVIVVLGSSEQGRFEDVKKLYEETLKYLNK